MKDGGKSSNGTANRHGWPNDVNRRRLSRPHVSIALQARRGANPGTAATGLKQSGHVAAIRRDNHMPCPRPPTAAHSFRPQAELPMTIQRSLIATAIATALTLAI